MPQAHMSPEGCAAWRAIVGDPGRALVCSDFDGVLSPIVSDPDSAWASQRSVDALARLGERVGKIAVVTGRVARRAVTLGGFDARPGLRAMSVLGLYGLERWDAASGEFVEPDAPAGVAAARAELADVLERAGVGRARVEDKRLSIGVHTRELDDPAEAFGLLERPLAELAARHGLHVEPGRNVIELRAPGQDKGDAVRALVAEYDPSVVVFAGDDLGDVAAFEAVRDLRASGRIAGLLICSGSEEQDALVALADVVVDGPDGVADLFTRLADDLAG